MREAVCMASVDSRGEGLTVQGASIVGNAENINCLDSL